MPPSTVTTITSRLEIPQFSLRARAESEAPMHGAHARADGGASNSAASDNDKNLVNVFIESEVTDAFQLSQNHSFVDHQADPVRHRTDAKHQVDRPALVLVIQERPRPEAESQEDRG